MLAVFLLNLFYFLKTEIGSLMRILAFPFPPKVLILLSLFMLHLLV